MERHRTILFDFDGVIADSFAAAFGTAQKHCMHQTETSYRELFEGNIYRSYDEMVGTAQDHSECNHAIDWWSTFSSLFDDNKGLFEEMDVIIKKLAEDYRLIIISSSVHKVIEPFLKTHGLDGCFASIYDAEVHRSKSEKIAMAFEKHGFGPNDCVMITDSKGDILEARAKDVASIGVTWGFNDYNVLLSGDPWRIVRLPSEIPNAVTEFFKSKAHA
jgi:HAD superfamily hydrolase (TIGR01549 family)